ncbi:chaperonin GroEL [Noviherbaspirillum denitrificans]|uniref:60 kDa chaperonin n=1 Tax=Noviherbaspirillum denitrificans TaxID=1968433 RepID=A0A254TN77_9BURK|nr:chaperonin GroEL [Noviherbaspirillum denitrificans]OWW21158.1 molecular chaperone GroEL [Noviherbaspirillum denitrificans]
MAARELHFYREARAGICAGMEKLANAVRVTLGPKGRTVMLENQAGPPLIINSGVVVARHIELADKLENLGASLLREVSAKTSESAGDGTTTATVLAQALVGQGMKYVAAGFDPMDLKRGIDAAVSAVVGRLRDTSRRVSTDDEIAHVGAISANGDKAIGDMIAEAMRRVGREGVIRAEDGRGMENELDVVDGMQFERGAVSPYFSNQADGVRTVLEDAWVLVTDGKLTAIAELLPVLGKVMDTKRPLLLIADEVSGDALATLVVNALRGVLPACAVRAPGFGDSRRAELEDIAILTGACLVSNETGAPIADVTLQQLGRVQRVEVDRDRTVLIGAHGNPEKIRSRIEQLRRRASEVAAPERIALEERTARLRGGVALIRVGATTETELKEKRSRVEDALHATRAAVDEGVGPGGGIALLRAREVLATLKTGSQTRDLGMSLVFHALESPLRQIVENAGGEADVVIEAVAAGNENFGFNAATGAYGDVMEMGIIDPTKVTRLALQNAASIAGLILTTDCAVTSVASVASEFVPGALEGMGL